MDVSKSFPDRVSTGRSGRTQACLYLVLSFLAGLQLAARADGISGRVYGPDGKGLPNTILTAQPEKGPAVDFKTDASGNFSVFLDPGRYVVSVRADKSLEGVIESYSQPVQQDIHLKKGTR
ncbi:MAG: carboxypeptidase-like regulatory domain-containing protein [Acidithiobacillales bacterium]